MATGVKHRKKSCNVDASTVDRSAAAYDDVSASIVPDGANGDFVDQTMAIWQPHSRRQLNREDGREIIENMTGFFKVLREWENAERMAKDATK